MSGYSLGVIEMVMSGGLVLGFCAWQYWSMTRQIARDKKAREASTDRARHPEGEHRLDDR